MSKQLIVSIPAEQKHLSRQIAQGVEEYADVSQAPSYTDLETIKLVLDIVAQGVGIAGGVAGVLTFLRSLQQTQAATGTIVNIILTVPGHPPVSVEEADAALLARLLMSA
ncbi:MAG: hypothetical protein WCP31_10110 [Chloroflexales bacterium]